MSGKRSLSATGHSIRWGRRSTGHKDDFYTPPDLARLCVSKVPLTPDDVVPDPCCGEGAFIDAYPYGGLSFDIKDGQDFYDWHEPVDWIVTNPPYSHLDTWLDHSAEVCGKGFAYLLGWNNLTARRIERLNAAGFGITSLTQFKVFEWYGMSAFVVWTKGAPGLIGFDRTVWREAPDER